jgi:flagellar biosynthetic protein FlhB
MSDSSKTEQPTQRRLEKAREEGQFPSAREFVGALQFMVFLGLLGLGGAHWWGQFQETTRWLFARALSGGYGAADLTHIAWRLFWQHLLPLALGGLAVAFATLGFRLITTRFGLSLKKLTPDPARLNPLSKLRELPRQNLPSLFQALILLPLFLWAVYTMARHKLEEILALPLGSVESGSRFIGSSLIELFWKAAGLFLVFGAVDLARQMHRYKQDLRMSKQDIKEEMKDLEGNPQMKARIRRLMRDRLRRQMMKEVPKATAVVVNPTHFAVAIRYQVESMAARSRSSTTRGR